MKSRFISAALVFSIALLQARLAEPPRDLTRYYEIAAQHKPDIHAVFNDLNPEERIFLYYLYRASLPGHYLASDQVHRHAIEIMELFESIYAQKDHLRAVQGAFDFDVDVFIEDVGTYLVYLWTNHGPYFLKEQVDQKRTPERLECKQLTLQNMQKVLVHLGENRSIEHLIPSIFDRSVEATLCVPGDINASSSNVYHPEFTNEDFANLPAEKRTQINAYFGIEQKKGTRSPRIHVCKVGGKYTKELEVAVHWLKKAHEHVQYYPKAFDVHTVESLDYMIQFLQTGDEELFKKHSIEWTKTNNRLDYVFGWIEVYNDPKQFRGAFQAEVTAKTVDMQSLNALLPSLEAALPFPDRFKRQNLDDLSAIPNASINTIMFANGFLGPLKVVSAYCLPNYPELRSEHGSKQIIYQSSKDIGQLVDADLTRALFNLPSKVTWLNQNDPDGRLHGDIWNVHCILHETLGHGSGRLDKHTFQEGDAFTIGNVTYGVGDTINVTGKNNAEFLGKYGQSLEELRAEIIALYTSIFNFDELAEAGLYKDWPQKIGKERLIEELIQDMAWTGLRRLIVQPADNDEIRGAHAQANTTIMNYMLDGGGLQLVKQDVEIRGQNHNVLGFKIVDIKKVKQDIIDLAQEVQRIKSTGDGQALDHMMETYGIRVRNPEHRAILHANHKTAVGNLKVLARIFPHYEPIEKDGAIVDIAACWPKDIIEQSLRQKELAYSID